MASVRRRNEVGCGMRGDGLLRLRESHGTFVKELQRLGDLSGVVVVLRDCGVYGALERRREVGEAAECAVRLLSLPRTRRLVRVEHCDLRGEEVLSHERLHPKVL